ncbi:hypothetical protein J2128_000394 [Methanomicrobium sp. W14]|uniref:hypothetical protein n=1 Tax=Methanomicrobium sp. W14 TaxID=2817839 RepID=UPI001AE9C2FB|nr:hypothetical protein [Methanomicrobium sp. W14]MBP2132473.1 hypothetical protein [Methanomicrobium sp. W14]
MDISGGNGKEIIIGILLFAVILAGFACLQFVQSDKAQSSNNDTVEPTDTQVSESSNVGGWVSHNLVLNAPSSKESQDSVMVYRTLPPVINKETTLELAKKFNVVGTIRDDTVVQSDDLRYGVEISKKSGLVIYIDQDRPNIDQDAPEYLPSDEEAIETATKFLKEKGLYPEGATEPVAQPEYSYSGGKIVFGQIGVWYNRYLDGLEVKGTQLDVGVGGNGDIIEYFANWREYEPYKEYPVITLDKAFENLKSEGVYVGKDNKDAQVSIDDAYLAYHTKAGAYTENYLEPVWVFKGNVMNEDNKLVTDVVQYVPALAEEPTELISK